MPVLGAAIGGIGSLIGGAIAGHGASSAANTQAKSAQTALDFQKQQYADQQAREAPWLASGQQALGQLNSLQPFQAPGADFTQDPGYQFRLAEGNKAIERSAAARGSVANPATQKALADYSENLASQEYGNVYARRAGEYQNTYNQLATRAGYGTQGNAALNAGGQNFATNAGNTAMFQGGALASGQAANGNIWGQTAANVGNIFGQGLAMSDLRKSSYKDPAGNDPAHWYI